jgi:peptide/nickel transport system substrate-binding protein
MSANDSSSNHRSSRRTFLATAVASAALLGAPRAARALGRTPVGGRLSLHVPWPTRSIDPHDLRDPTAALFGAAIADPLYALDAAGNPAPGLAAGLPSREALGTVVRLREGLRTARKVALDARDVVASIERARGRGAMALFADVPKPELYPKDALAVVFGKTDPHRLARALASPLAAILPRHFDPLSPDGTGAFRADCADRGLVLSRNAFAARGPSYLDVIDVFRADDLATSLRRFEAERDDLGWLGLGLHGDRKGASRFDLGPAAWIVLWVSSQASGGFGLPGVAQRLVDGVRPERLSHLGLGPLPLSSGDAAWGGAPAELLVDEGSAHLVEVARTLGPILSRPGHEITVVTVPRAELGRRRASKAVAMSLDVVRPAGPGPLGALLALSTADDAALAKELAKSPPKLPPQASARTLTRSLHVGVVGELRISGGQMPDLVLARGADGRDLGASFRRRGR